jgi:hypothetical protein
MGIKFHLLFDLKELTKMRNVLFFFFILNVMEAKWQIKRGVSEVNDTILHHY